MGEFRREERHMVFFDAARMTRPNKMDFKPPTLNRSLLQFFYQCLPFLLKHQMGNLRVQIEPETLDKLKAIQGERCLLLPNHPSDSDPAVMFELARQLDEAFFYVAAREVFDYSMGFRGWLFQNLGVYSLVRGTNDRKSIKTSIETLSENKGRLVIFVEGEISSQNDTLLPIEHGVIQLAFMALSDAHKKWGGRGTAIALCVPRVVAISLRHAGTGARDSACLNAPRKCCWTG